MGVETSLFLEIIDSHANQVLFSERKEEIQEKIKQAIREGKDFYKLLREYNFKANLHIQAENKHNAPNSLGCGCELCKRRHKYAQLKLSYHRRMKGFEASLNYGFYDESVEQKIIEEYNNEKKVQQAKIEKAKDEYYSLKRELESMGINFL